MKTFILLFISLTIFKLHAIPTYQELNKFPIYENTAFNFKVTETMMFKKRTVLLLAVVCNNTIKQRTRLLPGLFKISDHIRRGRFFDILKYRAANKVLSVKLKFYRQSHSCNLYVIYRNSDKPSESKEVSRQTKYNDSKFLLKKLKVSLHLHWKLKLYEKTLDHRNDGLHANAIGFIVCEASGGYPHASPTISGINQLINYKTGIVEPKKLKFTFTFKVDIRDFNKEIVCRCGEDYQKKNLGVFHHATKVYTDPSLKDGWLANGTKVRCLAMNGYPPPKTNWKVIKAPFVGAAKKYVVIQNNVLSLMGSTPHLSKWTFRCSANNTIPDSVNKGGFQDFEVIVGVKPFKFIYIILIIVVCFLVLAFGCMLFIKCLQVRRRKYSQSAGPRNFCHETHRHRHPDMVAGTKIDYVLAHDPTYYGDNESKESFGKQKFELNEHRPTEAIDGNKENMPIANNNLYRSMDKKNMYEHNQKVLMNNNSYIAGPIDEV